jgi:hypothetical protein
MKILCRTLFDCSRTGVTGAFRASEIPFVDRAEQTVDNQQQWNRSRNQQRNYETLLQIFGLRAQPQQISCPVYRSGAWEFNFEIEAEGVFDVYGDPDPLAGLKIDCEGVPMMLKLTEKSINDPMLITHGAQQNIWFEVINTPTEN